MKKKIINCAFNTIASLISSFERDAIVRNNEIGDDFWIKHYSHGGRSGQGSIDQIREWKWETIKMLNPNIDSVIDVGCGDISFWEGKECDNYIGIDISKTILERNHLLKPNWHFIHSSAAENQEIKSENVFCFDLLFHIIDDDTYDKILDNLTSYSSDWIFIFTWKYNPFTNFKFLCWKVFTNKGIMGKMCNMIKLPFEYLNSRSISKVTDGNFQYYRNLEKEFHKFEKAGFLLQDIFICPYCAGIGAMYVFRKKSVRR